jgi:hydroxymethylglutaryl-CoA lyase
VLGIIQRYFEAGFKTLSLADSAGHAYPDQVARMFEAVFNLDPTVECTCHFHNTYGLGLVNCYAAMQAGVKFFESSIAGLGGCPFTKVAAGNVCTEDFIHSLQRTNQRVDINLSKLTALAKEWAAFFKREMPGLVYKLEPLNAHKQGERK